MRIIVLFVLIAWLVTSLPQDAFIWASTTHAEGSWHWQMSFGRAFLLGFLPILTIWVSGILTERHLDETKKTYREIEKRWNRRAGRRDAQWAKENPLIDEEEFYANHMTPAKQLGTWVPRMFYLLISIIAISYFGYYEEYGTDLAMFKVRWWGLSIGDTIFRPLVGIVRTSITGVVTFVLGRTAAVLGVQDLPKDIGVFLGKVWAWTFPERPSEPVQVVESPKPERKRSEYSHWPERDVGARRAEIVRYVKENDPEREGVERSDIFQAVWNGRGSAGSTGYDDIAALIKQDVLVKKNNGNKITWAAEGAF